MNQDNVIPYRDSSKSFSLIGTPTGLPDLDVMTSGLKPSELMVLASRPQMGKTSLALQITHHVASKEQLPVVIFSLEMSKEDLLHHLACAEASINRRDFQNGQMVEGDRCRFNDTLDHLRQAPLFIEDEPEQTVARMLTTAQRLSAEHGQIGLIVVDYLQLVQPSYEQNISEIARELKNMAREMNCLLIALSQLPQNVEERENKRPVLSDLNGAGSIPAEADVVAFTYRPSLKQSGQEVAEVIIGKQPNGPSSTVQLAFQPEYARFSSLPN